jgi:hypothetical protein
MQNIMLGAVGGYEAHGLHGALYGDGAAKAYQSHGREGLPIALSRENALHGTADAKLPQSFTYKRSCIVRLTCEDRVGADRQ